MEVFCLGISHCLNKELYAVWVERKYVYPMGLVWQSYSYHQALEQADYMYKKCMETSVEDHTFSCTHRSHLTCSTAQQ